MSAPVGKGIMLWKSAYYGTLPEIIDACKTMGLRWVALKIGDGIDPFYRTFPDMPAAVAAFRAAGISVWGWHYIYGGIRVASDGTVTARAGTPGQEAAFARAQVAALKLDGYMIDAEKEYKVGDQVTRAKQFMAALAGIGVPVALCSYRFPSYHQTFPWKTFLAGCDLHMPQVYHGKDRGVIDLTRSASELLAFRNLPIIPVGRAYIGDGYGLPGITPSEMTAFMDAAVSKGMPAISWWALDFLKIHAGGEARQAAIAAYRWPGDVPLGPTIDERLASLEAFAAKLGYVPLK